MHNHEGMETKGFDYSSYNIRMSKAITVGKDKAKGKAGPENGENLKS
jgi:hypothetical protein